MAKYRMSFDDWLDEVDEQVEDRFDVTLDDVEEEVSRDTLREAYDIGLAPRTFVQQTVEPLFRDSDGALDLDDA
jgi:hypothetical protein